MATTKKETVVAPPAPPAPVAPTDEQIEATASLMSSFQGAFKSKTIWASVAIAAVSVGQTYLPAVLPYLTQTNTMYGGIAISVIMTALRIMTTKSLSDKVGS